MSRAFDRAGEDGPGEPFLPGHGSTSDSVANADPSRSSGEEDQAESRPPRPPNAWILYRAAKSAHIRAEIEEAADPQQRVSSRQRQSEVSKQLSQMWKAESKEVKDHYGALAEEKRSEHRLRYPNYRYVSTGRSTESAAGGPSAGDLQGSTSVAKRRRAGTGQKSHKSASSAQTPSASRLDPLTPPPLIRGERMSSPAAAAGDRGGPSRGKLGPSTRTSEPAGTKTDTQRQQGMKASEDSVAASTTSPHREGRAPQPLFAPVFPASQQGQRQQGAVLSGPVDLPMQARSSASDSVHGAIPFASSWGSREEVESRPGPSLALSPGSRPAHGSLHAVSANSSPWGGPVQSMPQMTATSDSTAFDQAFNDGAGLAGRRLPLQAHDAPGLASLQGPSDAMQGFVFRTHGHHAMPSAGSSSFGRSADGPTNNAVQAGFPNSDQTAVGSHFQQYQGEMQPWFFPNSPAPHMFPSQLPDFGPGRPHSQHQQQHDPEQHHHDQD